MNAYQHLDQIAIDNFRKYLQIPTVHPNINYDECVKFLKTKADELELIFNVYTIVPEKPIVILTWEGKQLHLPTILLNSHMDVVPVFEQNWIYKPFHAEIDSEGNIYGRGTQDVKSLGIQYLEAIRRLKKNSYEPKRSIHVSFVPDEEIGGIDGMKVFVRSEHFSQLHVGFALDEGIPGESHFLVYYGEKITRNIKLHCTGQVGHSSHLVHDTAGEKLNYMLKQFYNYRAQEKLKMHRVDTEDNAISINLTIMQGGKQINSIPTEFTVTFDARIPPNSDLNQFKNKIQQWCVNPGNGVWIDDFAVEEVFTTKLDENNRFWVAFNSVAENMGIQVETKLLNASSDARYLRSVGVPAIGFCPHPRTPNRAHQDNEFINVTSFIDGIEVFQKIIPALADA